MAIQESGATFDLVLVGGGVSALYTVLNLAQHLSSRKGLRASPEADKFRIAIVERSCGGLGGVPYTRRSCYTSLLITSLRDFLPDSERKLFIEWLDDNKNHIFDLHRRHGGALCARWTQTHEQEIATGAWEDLYLPRYLFGMYMDERLHRAIQEAEFVCDFKIIGAEVTDVLRAEHGFQIDLANSTSLRAASVVLALGSPPNRAKLTPPPGSCVGGVCLIDDPYNPGLDGALEQIETVLGTHPGPLLNVLLVGAAASTMDVLYALTDRWNEPRPLRFCILSPNSKLPDRVKHSSGGDRFVPATLQALPQKSEITAKEIYDAAARDIELSQSEGLTTSDTLAPVSAAVVALVKRLSSAEKWEFASVWGTALGRLQRRVGPEYSNVAAELAAQGRLNVIEGRFRHLAEIDPAGALIQIESRGDISLLPGRFQVVVNCAGFAKTSELPADHLLRRLLDRRLVRPNAASTGLLVNDEMEASPGLFVLGPLLAGNVVKGTPIWHVEHCGRISHCASELAEILNKRLTVARRSFSAEAPDSGEPARQDVTNSNL